MEDHRFDGLVRTMGHNTTRRGALGALAALAALGLGEAAAKKGKGRKKRHKKGQSADVCAGRSCDVRACYRSTCNPQTGACEYAPTPDAACDGGTCNGSGECVVACKPKTCAELGRSCGTAPDDGCGNPLDCGADSVCGSVTDTNCCGGKCCKANGILCSSNAECCNGDCRGIGSLKTCWAFTDYTCAA